MDADRRSPFATSLRRLREAAGLSQELLGERAGLSRRGISDLERGVRATPRLETVRMLAEGLGLSDVQRTELLATRNTNHHAQPISQRVCLPGVPVPPNAFIGRVREITLITGILQHEHVRLLTLAGPGGVGKTRIAIEVAHRLTHDYVDGVIFVDLQPVRGPGMMMSAIADRLGVPGQGEVRIQDVVAVALQGKSVLLVLDNCEQVVDSAPDIATLLDSCPHLRIIATSRLLLRVSAEHVVQVEPLTLPVDDDVDSLNHADAVTLFVARARSVDQGFAVDSANAPTIAAISRRLEGIPLAIELAAARIRTLPLIDLLARLQTQLPVLTGGVRDGPERHRTMHGAIAWSYNLLSPAAQKAFRTLAIFPDGCLLQAAVAVLEASHGFSEEETLNALEQLVDSSSLQRREGQDGHTRYRMLQAMQEFGLQQLATAGEDDPVQQAAHRVWCLPLAQKAEIVNTLPDVAFWLNRITAEYQNLRAHIGWLIDQDYMDDALDISGMLTIFRDIKGHYDEARRVLEMLLADHRLQAQTVARMRGLIGLGLICIHQADTVGAMDVLQPAVQLARDLGDRRYLSLALVHMGETLKISGRFDEAETVFQEATDIAVEIDDPFLRATAPQFLAQIYEHRGRLEEAHHLLQECLALSLSTGMIWVSAKCNHNLAELSIQLGELDQAEDLSIAALQVFTQLESRRDIPAAFLTRAVVARKRGDLVREEMMLQRALDQARDIGSMWEIGCSLSNLARIARLKIDLKTAQSLTFGAIHWFNRCGNLVDAFLCPVHIADIAIASGDAPRAAWCIGAVEGVRSSIGESVADQFPNEHQERIDAVKSVLGEEEYQANYDRGRSMTVESIVAEIRNWRWDTPPAAINDGQPSPG